MHCIIFENVYLYFILRNGVFGGNLSDDSWLPLALKDKACYHGIFNNKYKNVCICFHLIFLIGAFWEKKLVFCSKLNVLIFLIIKFNVYIRYENYTFASENKI